MTPAPAAIDTRRESPNNALMARPGAVRRVKSYSAASGFVYQYHFSEVKPARRGLAAGTEYIYLVTADRSTVFPLCIFVRRDALQEWEQNYGRKLTGTEEYAVAKMRLFQAFDEAESPAAARQEVRVDRSNLGALLAKLDL